MWCSSYGAVSCYCHHCTRSSYSSYPDSAADSSLLWPSVLLSILETKTCCYRDLMLQVCRDNLLIYLHFFYFFQFLLSFSTILNFQLFTIFTAFHFYCFPFLLFSIFTFFRINFFHHFFFP